MFLSVLAMPAQAAHTALWVTLPGSWAERLTLDLSADIPMLIADNTLNHNMKNHYFLVSFFFFRMSLPLKKILPSFFVKIYSSFLLCEVVLSMNLISRGILGGNFTYLGIRYGHVSHLFGRKDIGAK